MYGAVLDGLARSLGPTRFVDDIFRISWELSCIIMLGIIDIGELRLHQTLILGVGLGSCSGFSSPGLMCMASRLSGIQEGTQFLASSFAASMHIQTRYRPTQRYCL